MVVVEGSFRILELLFTSVHVFWTLCWFIMRGLLVKFSLFSPILANLKIKLKISANITPNSNTSLKSS